MEKSCTIQDVFERFYPSYEKRNNPPAHHRKTAYHIMNCKTGAFGVNISVCEDCGCISVHNNSCRSRCCPMCQEFPKEKWIDAQKENVLDAPYYHVVFTVPEELNSIIYSNQKLLYDALYQIMGAESFIKNSEKGLIEVAPLAYMRGRTLDNAFIILDEAQNTTPAQMKMFLTRIGFGSKVVVTGDASQKDLPRDAVSGLDVAAKVLKKIDDIGFCQLTSKDVVRHPLVQQIVQAYEDYEKKQKPSRSTGGTRTVRRKKNDHTD